MSLLTVKLPENSYDILIEQALLNETGARCLAAGLTGRAAIITNNTVDSLYGDTVRSSLSKAGYEVSTVKIEDGEEFKNQATLNLVYDALINAGIDRKSFIVALGGGVVGDLAGFAAATYLRGIPFVQLPTTLLAQVDSSVGGKTAIDHPQGKNLIGAFYQPRLVLIDTDTLNTLPKREFLAGMAEVVKYGVVIDSSFFDYLEKNISPILMMEPKLLKIVIYNCCRIKAAIIEQDEKESGLREVLNYGHTLGHALETLSDYRSLVHGEAVAIGMVLAARISADRQHCNQDDFARISGLINKIGLSVTAPLAEKSKLLDTLLKDKKSRNGSINFICNSGIGAHVVEKLSPQDILAASGLEFN